MFRLSCPEVQVDCSESVLEVTTGTPVLAGELVFKATGINGTHRLGIDRTLVEGEGGKPRGR